MTGGDRRRRPIHVFRREIPPSMPTGILGDYDRSKWEGLDLALAAAVQGGASILSVESPEVLGDSFEELMVNLSKVYRARLLLMVVEPCREIQQNPDLDIGGYDARR